MLFTLRLLLAALLAGVTAVLAAGLCMTAFVVTVTISGNPIKVAGSTLGLGSALHLYLGYTVTLAALSALPAIVIGALCYLALRQFGALSRINLTMTGAFIGLTATVLVNVYVLLNGFWSELLDVRALALFCFFSALGAISGWAGARVMAAVMRGGDPKFR